MAKLSQEEVAARLVHIYFREIARLGYKRRLALDEVINAYYYALSRLGDRQSAMNELMKKVVEEENELKTESKNELVSSFSGSPSETTVTETKTETTEKS